MLSWLQSDQIAANLADALFTLTDVSVKAALILLLALLLSFLLRKKAARVRHLLWSTALFGVLVLPALSFIVPAWHWRVLPAASAPPIVLPMPGEPGAPPDPAVTDVALMTNRSDAAVGSDSAAASIDAAKKSDDDPALAARPESNSPPLLGSGASAWRAWVFGAWLTGVVTVLIWFRMGLARADRFARNAKPLDDDLWRDLIDQSMRSMELTRRVRLLKSDEIDTPVTWGFSRPLILLPAAAEAWPAQRRRIVLVHELLHVKRHDWFVQIAARLASAMYWFNPLAWLAVRRLAIERELACDDDVISLGARPSEYATHLLDIARTLSVRTPVPVSALTMATSKLEGRLAAILSQTRRERRAMIMVPGIVALVGLVFGLAAIRPWRDLPAINSRSSLQTIAKRTSLDITAARQLLRQERWSDAAEILRSVTRADPSLGSGWFDLGYALHAAGRWDDAIAAHLRAAEFPELRGGAWYNVACAQAQKGDKEQALTALEKALAAGFYTKPQAVMNDRDLLSLHSDPRFEGLLKEFVPLKYRLERLDKKGDSVGLLNLLRGHPRKAANIIRSFLDDGMVLRELYGDAERAEIALLESRALRIARAAQKAFGRSILTEYAVARIGWGADERQMFRDAEYIEASLHPTTVRRSSYTSAIRSAQAVESLTRSLGDSIGLARALLSLGNLHMSVIGHSAARNGVSTEDELQGALAAYAETRRLARDLGLSYYEVLATHGMAAALMELGRLSRALVVIAEGIDLLARTPDNHFCTEFAMHFENLRIAVDRSGLQ